jgi:molybdopterin molybdotransferase
MRSVEEALEDVLGAVPVLGAESVHLLEARGRVLAEHVASDRALPPWDNSEMDGYALRSEDTVSPPCTLVLQGEVAAGHLAAAPLEPGRAYRIFTGAPLPPGADAVVKQEDVTADPRGVHLRAAVRPGQHVRVRGSDVAPGDRVLDAGVPIDAGAIGLCAALGRTLVSVRRRATVAIVSTGDELIESDCPPGPGQIVNSNSLALAALVAEVGAIPVRLGIAPDDRAAIARHLEGARFADVLLTVGGVSVGDHDFTRDVLAELGCELRFWKVNMKPGKPLAFGRWEGRPVFGLPGNPASAMVTFELFVRPALRKMMGHSDLGRPRARARLLEAISKEDGRRHYVRAVVERNADTLVVRALRKQSSGQLTSMVGVNALAILPEDSRGVAAGEAVEVVLL